MPTQNSKSMISLHTMNPDTKSWNQKWTKIYRWSPNFNNRQQKIRVMKKQKRNKQLSKREKGNASNKELVRGTTKTDEND